MFKVYLWLGEAALGAVLVVSAFFYGEHIQSTADDVATLRQTVAEQKATIDKLKDNQHRLDAAEATIERTRHDLQAALAVSTAFAARAVTTDQRMRELQTALTTPGRTGTSAGDLSLCQTRLSSAADLLGRLRQAGREYAAAAQDAASERNACEAWAGAITDEMKQ